MSLTWKPCASCLDDRCLRPDCDWPDEECAEQAVAEVRFCGAVQPGSFKTCERLEGHDGEHRTTLSPRRTFNYWNGDGYPVKYRVGSLSDFVPEDQETQ